MKQRCSKVVDGRRCVFFAGVPHEHDAPLLLDDAMWARIVEQQEKTEVEAARNDLAKAEAAKAEAATELK